MFFTKGQRVKILADVFIPSTVTDTRVSICLGIIGSVAVNGSVSGLPLDTWVQATYTLIIQQDGLYSLRIQSASSGTGHDFRVKNITVTTDTTVTEHIPYRKTTLPIPEDVRSYDGYGWSAESMYYGAKRFATNSIEWDEGGKASFVKRVERKVFDGTEAWSRKAQSNGAVYFEIMPANKKPSGAAFTNKYPADMPASIPYTNNTNYGFLVFPDNPHATADEWKAQLAAWAAAGDPLVLYYELATPIVTDISHLMPRDNFLPVEGGGVIIAANENADAAPTTVVYQLKEG